MADHRSQVLDQLPTPADLRAELPLDAAATELVRRSRHDLTELLAGRDDRLALVAGPCSVHEPAGALTYAERLAALAAESADSLIVVMRVYVEKPRTRLGWKGLVGDPHLDGSHDLAEGLRLARRLMIDVTTAGLPVACEFLDPFIAPYLADLVTWGSIGARTVQSQPHRQLASGLSMPLGVKNPTSGRVEDAVDALVAAGAGHVGPGLDGQGRAAVVATTGNPDCHVVLRGHSGGPNYSAVDVARTLRVLAAADLPPRVFVDASHGNSGKDPERQKVVVADLARRLAAGEPGVLGVMLESFLVPGRQDPAPGRLAELVPGQSITDACLGWADTTALAHQLAAAVAARRTLPLVAAS